MQRNDNTPAAKAAKTVLILGIINVVSSPLYYISGSASTLLALALNAFSIYQFHELGQSRRPGSNILTKGWSLFSSWISPISPQPIETNEMENTYRNVINGGAAVVDEAATTIDNYCRNKPRR